MAKSKQRKRDIAKSNLENLKKTASGKEDAVKKDTKEVKQLNADLKQTTISLLHSELPSFGLSTVQEAITPAGSVGFTPNLKSHFDAMSPFDGTTT